MSYLQLDKGIADFEKAVISLWFRVPKKSIAAATDQFYAVEDAGTFDLNLHGIIPLVTFGPNETMVFYTYDFTHGFAVVELGSSLMGPCFIGVRCGPLTVFGEEGGSSNPNVSVLQAKLQYSSGGQPPPTSPDDPTNAGYDFFQVGGYLDGSDVVGTPEFNFKSINVVPDKWHHVLVSFDISPGAATSQPAPGVIKFESVCKFWWAFDDVNYDGEYLWPYCPVCLGEAGDRNGIVSSYCMGPRSPYSFAAGPIPTDGWPVGIPTSAESIDHVYPVELAELQVFTGVTLDTFITTNRRAFIDTKGAPVNPQAAETLLRKPPDILFHGSGNWIAGTNTGKTMKINEIGKPFPVPAASFKPTGAIVGYSPDPSLHGPQSPPPPKPPAAHSGMR